MEGAWQRMSKLAKHREALMADGDADATRAAMGAMASGMNQMLDDQVGKLHVGPCAGGCGHATAVMVHSALHLPAIRAACGCLAGWRKA